MKRTDPEVVPAPNEGLTDHEEREVSDRIGLRAAMVYEIIQREGQAELARGSSALWWSGLAAGISIGFSFLAEAIIAARLPESQWKPLIDNLGYSVGFLIVILGRQQLFTENTLTAVLPAVKNFSAAWMAKLARLWLIVLSANVVGCFLFASAIFFLPIAGAETTTALNDIVVHLFKNDAWQMFTRGIAAGWIIAALVWMLPSSEGGEFYIILLMTYLIALGDFTHVIAGSAEAIYGVYAGLVTSSDAVFTFFLPTLAGNVFGGTVLFAVLSYAQVRDEIR